MLDFHIYDVFTDTPFTGNPLAIVEGAEALSTRQMQAMAREFNLSETIFILPPADPGHSARVRIFTPAFEMPFAGHPTIGCAIHLALSGADGPVDTTVTLEEEAGLVPVRVTGAAGAVTGEFVAPVTPDAQPIRLDRARLAAAFDLTEQDIGGHTAHLVSGGHPFAYIELSGIEALSRARPGRGWRDFTEAAGADAVYLYCPGEEADFEARMFAPEAGVGEDPATGSATALFTGQLLANGALGDGNSTFRIRQGRDMGRESWLGLSVRVAGGTIEEIRVSGAAVPVSSGRMTVPI